MSDQKSDKPETIRVAGTVVAFTISSIVGAAVMVLAMFWNHNGGF
ncbi:MAG: hypothetical protein AB7G37_20695 [Solirubrobacteraceae bacterium]